MEYFSSEETKSIIIPVLQQIISLPRPAIIGLQGGQGTGKTTLAKYLREQLQNKGFKVEVFSLDDFYKSAAERKQLAKRYPDNPYYQIPRGLPGTHRIKYLLSVLKKIKQGKPTEIPVFDKSLHGAYGEIAENRKIGKLDFVIMEGWCLGIPPVSVKQLVQICTKNKIPLKNIDPTLEHSATILTQIRSYQQLWKYLNFFIMLKPDSPDLHQRWRWQQERELKKKTGKGMSKKEIQRFVGLFLPFTYVGYEKIKPQVKIRINKRHEFYKIGFGKFRETVFV